jgi:hypothetical protein
VCAPEFTPAIFREPIFKMWNKLKALAKIVTDTTMVPNNNTVLHAITYARGHL